MLSYSHILASLSGGIRIFTELFYGKSETEIRKSKVGDKLVEINNGFLPKIQEPESNSKDV